MQNKPLLFILFLICICTIVNGEIIQDLRLGCKDDNTLYALYPIRISIDNQNKDHYIGYATGWKWYEFTPDHWTAKYGGMLYKIESLDKGVTWGCPIETKQFPQEGIELGVAYSDSSLGILNQFLPVSYPNNYGNFSSCGWFDAEGNEQFCRYSTAVGLGVIYPTNQNWEIATDPLIGYDNNSQSQKQFLVNNGYKSKNRRYDLIYFPTPINLGNNKMDIYFGGWKGENTSTLPICPIQGADNWANVVTNGTNYKYCNCYNTWEQQGAGWWDQSPYDLCTGDKIYYATNQYSTNPYDFRAYSGNALNSQDNSIAGEKSAWASETWQPILWTQGVKEACQDPFCKKYFSNATATNDFTVVKVPNGKYIAYWTTGFKSSEIFSNGGMGENEGGVLLVAVSDDPYHFLLDKNLQPLKVNNWNQGTLQGDPNNYVFDRGIDIPSAVYDDSLKKIILFLHYWDRTKIVKPIPFYRVLIDPSNPYVAENVTKINSIITIPKNPICSQYQNTTYTQTQITSFRSQWAQNQLTLNDFLTKIRIWKYCS